MNAEGFSIGTDSSVKRGDLLSVLLYKTRVQRILLAGRVTVHRLCRQSELPFVLCHYTIH